MKSHKFGFHYGLTEINISKQGVTFLQGVNFLFSFSWLDHISFISFPFETELNYFLSLWLMMMRNQNFQVRKIFEKWEQLGRYHRLIPLQNVSTLDVAGF